MLLTANKKEPFDYLVDSNDNTPARAVEVVSFIKAEIQKLYGSSKCLQNSTQSRPLPASLPFTLDKMKNQLFLACEGKTIRQYALEVRVNKLKELLLYTHLPSDVIAFKLHYASAGEMEEELLHQTGLTLSFFHHLKEEKADLAQQAQFKRKGL
jgi:hypothetical protein